MSSRISRALSSVLPAVLGALLVCQPCVAQPLTAPRIIDVQPRPGTTVGDGVGLDLVRVRLSEPVVLPDGAVQAWGVTRGQITGFTASLDATRTLLSIAFTPPILDERVTVILDYSITGDSGVPLD